MRHDIRDLQRDLRRAGCAITVTGGGHLRISVPGGGLVFAASTPGDRRTIHNLRAQLRRSGAAI